MEHLPQAGQGLGASPTTLSDPHEAPSSGSLPRLGEEGTEALRVQSFPQVTRTENTGSPPGAQVLPFCFRRHRSSGTPPWRVDRFTYGFLSVGTISPSFSQ